jgi:hypothetical protein
MNDYFTQFEESSYLVDGYVEADRAYGRFAASGDQDALRRAGRSLCDTLSRLRGDGLFWAELIDAVGMSEKERGRIGNLLSSLIEFSKEEEEILIARGLTPEEASALVSQAVNAIEIADQTLTGGTIENLRSRVSELGEEICRTSSAGPRGGKVVRLVKRGLKIVGGGATIVVNGTSGLAFPPAVVSICGGVGLMLSTVETEK